MIRRNIAVVLCAALVIGAAGCAGLFGEKEEKTASELAAEGEAYFKDKKYLKAIEVYENLRDWYPYSKYTKTAEIRIADAHYHRGKYEQALAEYEYYERMHPGDEKIPYVIYQIGMCHYERIKSIDRTQVPTKKALETFSRLRDRFPESRYSKKAAPKIKECRKQLAGHEFYVGRFYFKSGDYEAALGRFKIVTENYPDIEKYSRQAEEYIKRCRKHLAEPDE
ncbi:MAG: outer membrane protein assembly factor BamD [Desulfobacteraceae bacterium]|nr:outer membrane protein assembly factor BamD [Desulfobacteraceae bacterium]